MDAVEKLRSQMDDAVTTRYVIWLLYISRYPCATINFLSFIYEPFRAPLCCDQKEISPSMAWGVFDCFSNMRFVLERTVYGVDDVEDYVG